MTPFFCTIPHSGEKVPQDCAWLQGLPEVVLMRDVDRYVDRLYEDLLKSKSVSVVKTEWHRYAGDLNRVPEDVDASSVASSKNPAGLHRRGFHWVITTLNEPLMKEPMSEALHQKLVQQIYEPFHREVRKLYESFQKSGAPHVYQLDLHSMPSLGTKEHRDPGERRADIVISDCGRKSSRREFVDLVILAYVRAGFKVGYNWPYLGGRVSEQYGIPSQGQHCVQVEMNRSLYMNEETKAFVPEAAEKVKKQLKTAFDLILSELPKLG
ncbi:MAG: N-formylglutamate amidohydrolase [Proteobacteria bacterium]|jgi:N-formylglutamate amidohydrolase|nr:N-formylglutamate amidohydrolase [Pseudomonadota bacterium]